MAKKTKLKHGEARLEFVACREKIEEMLNKGHGISSIHRELHKNGMITMSYKTLQDKINKFCKGSPGVSPVKRSGAASSPLPVSQKPTVQSGVKLAELDEAIELATAKRGNLRKKSGDDRKDVIG